MVEVTVRGAYYTDGDDRTRKPFVILDDRSRMRKITIFLGQSEAWTIDYILQGEKELRPMTIDFVTDILIALEGQLEGVYVTSVINDLFFGIARFNIKGQVKDIAARPSDAVALALRMNRPIFVAEDVMEQCSTPLRS